jgi:hypothetical protein
LVRSFLIDESSGVGIASDERLSIYSAEYIEFIDLSQNVLTFEEEKKKYIVKRQITDEILN